MLNHEDTPVDLVVHLEAASDFADLFEVKESRVPARPPPEVSVADGVLRRVRSYDDRGVRRGVQVKIHQCPPPEVRCVSRWIQVSAGKAPVRPRTGPYLGESATPPAGSWAAEMRA